MIEFVKAERRKNAEPTKSDPPFLRHTVHEEEKIT